MNTNTPDRQPDSNPANRDPITGTPGSHPISTGAGAVAGGLTGAALGSVAGPIGTAVGGVAGAVAGGYAGNAAGEAVNPTEQDKYWRSSFSSRPYAKDFNNSYDDAAPAYRYGWESASKPANKGRRFDEVESTLKNDWDRVKGTSATTWDKAKVAVKDAWNRIIPGRD